MQDFVFKGKSTPQEMIQQLADWVKQLSQEDKETFRAEMLKSLSQK